MYNTTELEPDKDFFRKVATLHISQYELAKTEGKKMDESKDVLVHDYNQAAEVANTIGKLLNVDYLNGGQTFPQSIPKTTIIAVPQQSASSQSSQ